MHTVHLLLQDFFPSLPLSPHGKNCLSRFWTHVPQWWHWQSCIVTPFLWPSTTQHGLFPQFIVLEWLFLLLPGPPRSSFYLYLICVGVLPAYMSVYHTCAWYLQGPEEGVGSPGSWVIAALSHHVGVGNRTGSSGSTPLLFLLSWPP